MNQEINNTTVESVKTLAILQITRLGDLLQTVHAIKDVKQTCKKLRLILVARKQFAKPLNFLISRYFDKIIYLDMRPCTLKNNASLSDIRKNLQATLHEIGQENIDVLVNLSFSKSSSYLCSLIKSSHYLGPISDHAEKLSICDKWSQFVYSTVMQGALNPFSLTDIFRHIVGAKGESPFIKQKNLPIKQIIIHPFASIDKKKWKSDKWSEIISKTAKDNPNLIIKIVGSPEERTFAEQILSAPIVKNVIQQTQKTSAIANIKDGQIQNLTGKSSLEELFSMMTSDTLFIGHDSSIGHLAALAGIPTITIALGPVRAHETTPYSQTAYTLAPRTACHPCFPSDDCNFFQCHADIPYQIVCSAIKQFIDESRITKEFLLTKNSAFHLNAVKLYRASYPDNRTQFLTDILEENSSTTDTFRTMYRILWSYFLEEHEENLQFPKLGDNRYQELLHYLSGTRQLYELAEFGKKYSQYILEEISSKNPNLQSIKDYSFKIDEIDKLHKTLKTSYPLLGPLIDFFLVARSNLPGDNIVGLSESSFLSYTNSGILSSVLYELIEKILAEHKISKRKSYEKNI